MKRIILGFVLGAVFMLPASAFARNTVPQAQPVTPTQRLDALCRATYYFNNSHLRAWRIACPNIQEMTPLG